MEFKNADQPTLSNNSKYFLALLPGDTLVILNLFTHAKELVANVVSFEMDNNGNNQWIKYSLVGDSGAMVIRKLDGKKKYQYTNIYESHFSAGGGEILMRDSLGLYVVTLKTNERVRIPESSDAKRAILDASGTQVAFLTDDDLGNRSIKYFKQGDRTSRILVDKKNIDLCGKSRISDNILNFTSDGQRLFFSYKYSEDVSQIDNRVLVWSYKDKVLKPKELIYRRRATDNSYCAVVDINSTHILLLENYELELAEGVLENNHFALLKSKINENEYYWNNQSQSLYLMSFESGRKTKLAELKYPGFQRPSLIQKERFVVWFDSKEAKFYSFNTQSQSKIDICALIPNKLSISERGEADKIRERRFAYGLQEIDRDGNYVFIYDCYDIWKVDLLGGKNPINITKGLGKANSIRFRIVPDKKYPLPYRRDMILLYAFNMRTKENGFWEAYSSSVGEPSKLIMDSKVYYFKPTSILVSANVAEDPSQFKPIKSKDKQAFIVRRMSTKESPNLYYTRDFHSFSAVSDIHPEKEYIWPESQLITWTLPDGLKCDGVLYKPQDFDSSRKYPVIFNYYERRSENLNGYKTPELFSHNVNIPWFVSREYLVFEPDFYYRTGEVATNIINTIESSIKRLDSIPYVDTKRMAAQGQSFGGYETNVIITGTTLFKAACEMAGPTNIISEYNSLRPSGDNNQTSSDNGQRNIGVSPWENPEIFIRNSPVLHIGKIQTPLLIIHNPDDESISYNQALELFLGMRRANKKVWMLEYKDEDHTVSNSENQLDLTIRIQQFFDYYLKATSVPIWMVNGNTSFSGLELDSSNTIP
ncbi:alpha/beta hydrolase family protein [Chitinophaga filiformis]|uniref:Prolyl oligopeptidase family serine peptidase n=1 Tax=Chitinophaga filiformis TaxID=104663 RepID=A0ABY4I0W3_CHIFI|nr:prolyl oligopeptidase family serine peptidase [Chitinophaga filiformis]UPK69726.1 prolyl oligopeptidase family serine peptidase [Chitinophaga filiformis]